MTKVSEAKYRTIRWLNMVKPTTETLEALGKKYKFHHLDIEDCFSENQRAKIDEYSKYIFVVMHFPYYNKGTNQVEVEEVDIFIGQNYLITIHQGKLKVLNKLFERMESLKSRKKMMSNGTGFLLYEVLDEMLTGVFPIVDDIVRGVQRIEHQIFSQHSIGARRDNLKEILLLKKDIITLRRTILPQRQVVAQLEHKNKRFLPQNLEVYFDDVVDKIERLWGDIENVKELVLSVQETNESLISHATNNVIKLLTIFSVIMMPLTVITGAYGMNVNLPWGQQSGGDPYTFFWIIGFMLFICCSMLFIFKRNRWL